MAAFAVVDDSVMELMAGAGTVTEVMTVLLMALTAGWCFVTMAGVAVAGAEAAGMLLMQRTVRTILEAGVASGAFAIGLAQRPARGTGHMASLAVIDKCGMEVMPRSCRTVAEIVPVYLVAFITGRSFWSMAGCAVCRAEIVGVHLMQSAARSALEAGVAAVALTKRLP